MNRSNDDSKRKYALTALASAALLWLSQPPYAIWPLAGVALVPWLMLIVDPRPPSRRDYRSLWLVATFFWLLSLQGLRHAHPVMYLCWIALSGYLAIYAVLFVAIGRQMVARGIPLWIAAAVAWVGLECLRNYLLTGISAAMLGHTMADVPVLIQIADLFGTYGVSFVLVSVNVAILTIMLGVKKKSTVANVIAGIAVAITLLAATIFYGQMRLREELGPPLSTFALIQRGEPVEYEQDLSREVELFQNYAQQSMEALRQSDQDVDVVVWPESMYSAGSPWIIAENDAVPPVSYEMTPDELRANVKQRRQMYRDRAAYLQSLFASLQSDSSSPPDLMVGCGVVHYGKIRCVYSGVVHIDGDGSLPDWYAKTHLVMFGEYVPIASHIPGIRSLVPSNLLLCSGEGAKRFMVDETAVSANICIETAVERVTVNQLAELRARDQTADVVVTVTNDGWFDDSSVLDHHLRCAQLVAVGCRRPILSAANNGPTAWIDSRGQLVARLPKGANDAIIATPLRDSRISLYQRIGDWPARSLALLCLLFAVDVLRERWKEKRDRVSDESATA